MTIPLVRAAGDFVVARPIPWDEDDTLRDHIDRVVDALTGEGQVVEVDTEAELDRGSVMMAIVLADTDEADADRLARETFASSIQYCDARHTQLLTPEEEEALSAIIPSRSGLLTPQWRLRRLSVETFAGG